MTDSISLRDRPVDRPGLDEDYRPAQQPDWPDPDEVAGARAELASRPPVVDWPDTLALKESLARAATGEACVVQAGDCAEDPNESDVYSVAGKIELLDVLADIIRVGAGSPAIRVGRIAGQYAKPRSEDHETVDGVRLPVFRGPLVNGSEPSPLARRPDPTRMLLGHTAARRVCAAIEELGRGRTTAPEHRVWTSHEALLLDYETALVRPTGAGGRYLASTHWPWIGNRTSDPRGAHVQFIATIDNPVACKVGAGLSERDLLLLCACLDPHREPGRLTLISRFGAARIDRLAPLVRAVRRAGHPVLWLCDPMHGNTLRTASGRKVRRLTDIMNEIREFVRITTAHGGRCAGLHLEASPGDIRECDGAGFVATDGPGYRSLCDPRLNLTQAVAVAAHWQPRAVTETRAEFAELTAAPTGSQP